MLHSTFLQSIQDEAYGRQLSMEVRKVILPGGTA